MASALREFTVQLARQTHHRLIRVMIMVKVLSGQTIVEVVFVPRGKI